MNLHALARHWLVGCALALAAVGCTSLTTGDPRHPLISIEIHNSPATQIVEVARQVFEEAGYTCRQLQPTDMRFEMAGSRWNTLFHGDWSSGDGVWVRAKCSLEYRSAADHVLHCTPFYVADHGDPRFETEKAFTSLKAGPYKKLLKRIKARCEAPR